MCDSHHATTDCADPTPARRVAIVGGCRISRRRRRDRNRRRTHRRSKGFRDVIEANHSRRNAPANRRRDLCDSLAERSIRSARARRRRSPLLLLPRCDSEHSGLPDARLSFGAGASGSATETLAITQARQPASRAPRGWRARTATSGPARIAGTLTGVGCQRLRYSSPGLDSAAATRPSGCDRFFQADCTRPFG